ncbi:MAG: hypothetical protein KDA60_01530, partial [Planctomycetales bacterium]|nr:hypothetical protein [Planctomycetales bacterium]
MLHAKSIPSRTFFAILLVVVTLVLPTAEPHCRGKLAAAEDAKKPAKIVTYADDVQPILRQKCFSCHNPDKKSSDLDLTNYTNLMQGGAAGAAVEPGDLDNSYLYQLITHESEPAMPPESPKLPDEMIAT